MIRGLGVEESFRRGKIAGELQVLPKKLVEKLVDRLGRIGGGANASHEGVEATLEQLELLDPGHR